MTIQGDVLLFNLIRANRRDTGYHMINTSADAAYTSYSISGPFFTIGHSDLGTLDDDDVHVLG